METPEQIRIPIECPRCARFWTYDEVCTACREGAESATQADRYARAVNDWYGRAS